MDKEFEFEGMNFYLTAGGLLDIISVIAKLGDKDQAKRFIYFLTECYMVDNTGKSKEECRDMVLKNIGYISGYLDSKTYHHVLEIFEVEHPYFGNSYPNSTEAFNIGCKIGEELSKKLRCGDFEEYP